MKRVLIAVSVIILFTGALAVWYTQNQLPVAQAETTRQAFPVETGDIVKTIKATGNLEAKDEIELSFEMNGLVKEVYVKRGQEVKAGQPLAQLDTTSLQLAVSQAEISLDDAKTEWAQVQSDINQNDLASARAALASAQASYDALLADSDEDEVTVATANLRTAELALEQAEGAYNQVAWKGGYAILDQLQALQDAQIDYATALANYNLAVKGADDADLKAAEAQVASAQATLNNLLQGASDEEIALAEVKVRLAQLSLNSALRDLDEATLIAPIDATVTAVNIQKGERTTEGSTGAAAIVLTDLSSLHIDVEVDEIDVPSVDVGQPAVVTVDALPGDALPGVVTAIAPVPVSVGDGVVTYEVAVTLNTQNEKARPGMTSNVEIETERRGGVLLIPSALIQVDDSTGQTYVEKPAGGGQPVRVDITLGERSGAKIEVQSGLQAGDLVFAPEAKTIPSAQATTQSDPRMPMPGLMMGPPPGGGRSFGGGGNQGSGRR